MFSKKICLMSICLLTAIGMTGCINRPSVNSKPSVVDVNGIIQSGIENTYDEQSAKSSGNLPSETMDIDLTVLPISDVHEAMYGLLNLPSEYVGKIIKMSGECHIYYEQHSGEPRYTCAVPETTIYLAQEINVKFDNDYYGEFQELPKDGEAITIVGTYDTDNRNGILYSVIKDVHWMPSNSLQFSE